MTATGHQQDDDERGQDRVQEHERQRRETSTRPAAPHDAPSAVVTPTEYRRPLRSPAALRGSPYRQGCGSTVSR